MENINKEVKEISITEEIIKRLGTIGYCGEINQLLRYYLKENIKYLFGKEEVPESDIEFLISNDGIKKKIEIKSIYSDYSYCILSGYEGEKDFIRCEKVGDSDEKKCTEFEIIDSNTNCSSRLTLSWISTKESLKIKYLCHEKKDNKFILKYLTSNLNDEETINYAASLVPLNVREKSKEWFSYNRVIPPVIKEESFFKRLYDEIKGLGNSRIIVTSYDMEDIINFSSEIYSALQEDAKRVLGKSFEEPIEEQKEKRRIQTN